MDPTAFFLVGGLMILVGFLNQIRTRMSRVRHRLQPAASIRSGARQNQGLSSSSEPSDSSGLINILLMLGGAVVVIAGILAGS